MISEGEIEEVVFRIFTLHAIRNHMGNVPLFSLHMGVLSRCKLLHTPSKAIYEADMYDNLPTPKNEGTKTNLKRLYTVVMINFENFIKSYM